MPLGWHRRLGLLGNPRLKDIPEGGHVRYQHLLVCSHRWSFGIPKSQCHSHFITKENSGNTSLSNTSQSLTCTEMQFSAHFEAQQKDDEDWSTRPLCAWKDFSQKLLYGSTNSSDSVIAHYLLQPHFDDLGDNIKRL